MTTAELYDELQEMFGIGDWSPASDKQWYQARMVEIGKLKRLLKSRRLSADDVHLAAQHARENQIPIVATWQLLFLIPDARKAQRPTPKVNDAVQDALNDAIERDDLEWAQRLTNVDTRDTGTAAVVREYRAHREIQERDAAMARVDAAAPEAWKAAAEDVVRMLARRHREFCNDDVWFELEARGVPCETDRRALGPMMRRLVREGLVSHVRDGKSRRRHAGQTRFYQGVVR